MNARTRSATAQPRADGGKLHRPARVAEVMWRILLVLGVLAAATLLGFWWRSRNGRITGATPMTSAHGPLTALGVDPSAADVTLVQFSSAFCQPCRATRAILADVARMLPGVAHVEVDAEAHLDAVRELDVRRTPTVLVVARDGRIVRRASGQPRKADVIAAVAPFLADAPGGAPADAPQGETALPDAGTPGT